MTISGNYNNIGSIKNTNNEILRILEYSPSEIIGQNVSRLMPKVIADMHDIFLRNFLETGEQHVMWKERIVYAQSKSGYLIPCTLMTKVIPNLIEGIRIVGFLKELEME